MSKKKLIGSDNASNALGGEQASLSQLADQAVHSGDTDAASRFANVSARRRQRGGESAIDRFKDGQTIHLPGFSLTTTGLLIEDGATQEAWQNVGDVLFALEGSLNWLIGDWLAYGESYQWGDIPQLAESMGLDYGHLRNLKWVCQNVNLSLRSDKLSFAHHKAVASLSPQDQRYWLELAASEGLSSRDLIRAIKDQQPQTQPDVPSLADPIHSKRFKSIFRALERNQTLDPETVAAFDKWWQEVKGRLG